MELVVSLRSAAAIYMQYAVSSVAIPHEYQVSGTLYLLWSRLLLPCPCSQLPRPSRLPGKTLHSVFTGNMYQVGRMPCTSCTNTNNTLLLDVVYATLTCACTPYVPVPRVDDTAAAAAAAAAAAVPGVTLPCSCNKSYVTIA